MHLTDTPCQNDRPDDPCSKSGKQKRRDVGDAEPFKADAANAVKKHVKK